MNIRIAIIKRKSGLGRNCTYFFIHGRLTSLPAHLHFLYCKSFWTSDNNTLSITYHRKTFFRSCSFFTTTDLSSQNLIWNKTNWTAATISETINIPHNPFGMTYEHNLECFKLFPTKIAIKSIAAATAGRRNIPLEPLYYPLTAYDDVMSIRR